MQITHRFWMSLEIYGYTVCIGLERKYACFLPVGTLINFDGQDEYRIAETSLDPEDGLAFPTIEYTGSFCSNADQFEFLLQRMMAKWEVDCVMKGDETDIDIEDFMEVALERSNSELAEKGEANDQR